MPETIGIELNVGNRFGQEPADIFLEISFIAASLGVSIGNSADRVTPKGSPDLPASRPERGTA
jgi:hypothetical protein